MNVSKKGKIRGIPVVDASCRWFAGSYGFSLGAGSALKGCKKGYNLNGPQLVATGMHGKQNLKPLHQDKLDMQVKFCMVKKKNLT